MSRGITSRSVLLSESPIDEFDGCTIEQVGRALNKSRANAYGWLVSHGYRLRDGYARQIKTVNEIEDEINARSVNYGPCFRCGCRICGCGRRG
jgi:hypothetical protein